MNEMGLAQMLGQTQPMRDVDQIVAMLQQGVTPEELVQQGVPVELVQEAVRILSQEATAIPEGGLAQSMMARGSV